MPLSFPGGVASFVIEVLLEVAGVTYNRENTTKYLHKLYHKNYRIEAEMVSPKPTKNAASDD